MKKYFRFIIAFVLTMLMLGTSAMAADKIAGGALDNGMRWSLNDDGELFIYKADSMPDTAMPDFDEEDLPPWHNYFEQITSIVLDVGVTTVGDYAFYNCTEAESVEIRADITSIGDNAFYNCESIKEIELYESIKTLGESCFYGCDGLTSIKVPSKVTEIPMFAFMDCINLEEIILPEGITYIGNQAICCCESLKEIELPSTLEELAPWVFIQSGIKEITIPENVSVIDLGVFNNCDNLVKINVDEDNQHFKSVNGVLYTADGKELVAVPGVIETLTVENGTEIIRDYAVRGHSNLTEVIIPEGVTEIGQMSFGGSSIESIELPLSLEKIDNGAFLDCQLLEKVLYAGSIADWVEIGIGTGNESLTEAELICAKSSVIEGECGANSTIRWKLENNVLTITGEGEIKDYTYEVAAPWTNVQKEIKKVIVGDEITAIGNYAFAGCLNMEEVSLPSSLERIGDSAFFDCKALEEIDIPSTVEEIENHAFWQCESLTEVIIPEGVETIEQAVFYNCNKLESITIPEGVKTIGQLAFVLCRSLDDIILPESLEAIESSAFEVCDSLTEIILGKNVSEIGAGAFGRCKNLEGIYVDEDNQYFKDIDGVVYTKDGKELVAAAGKVEVLVIEEDTEIIRERAVYWNTDSLVSVTIPDGVTEIGERAFSGCGALEDITIPDTVEKIGMGAFESNYGLVNVYYQGSEEQWVDIKFAIYNEDVLKVKPYTEVEGTVTYSNGEYAEDVTVKLLYEDGRIKDTTTTDSKGRYEFEDVEIGRFTVSVKGDEENISIKRKGLFSAILTGNTDLVIAKTYKVFGTTDEDARVYLIDEDGRTIEKTGRDTEFEFIDVPNGTYTVKAVSDDASAKETIVVFNADVEVNFELGESSSTLEGTVKVKDRFTDEGTVRYGVLVKLVDEDGRIVGKTITDKEGRYEFDGLEDGKYCIVASTEEMHYSGIHGFYVPVKITGYGYVKIDGADNYTVDIVLIDGTIIVPSMTMVPKIDGIDEIVTVLLKDTDGNEVDIAESNEEGKIVFEDVSEGVYIAEATTENGGEGTSVVAVIDGEVEGNTSIRIEYDDIYDEHLERIEEIDCDTREEALEYADIIAEEKLFYDGLSEKQKKGLPRRYVKLLNKLIELISVEIEVEGDGEVQFTGLTVSSEEIKNKEEISYTVVIEETDAWEMSDEGIETDEDYYQLSVENAAQDKTLAQYYEITMEKDGDEVTDISKDTDTTGSIMVTVEIPEEYQGYESYSMVHMHNGEAVTLVDLDDEEDTITVELDGFSTFVLMCDGENSDDDDKPSKPGDEFDISISGKIKNGEVETDVESAEEGDEVVITVMPDDGYELDELTIEDEDGEEIEVEKAGKKKYIFIMPASEVTIFAEFVSENDENDEDDEDDDDKPTKPDDEHDINLPKKFKNGKVKIDEESAEKGDEVVITVTPDDGYELEELTVEDEDGEEIEVKLSDDGKYIFIMPDCEVSIDASFVKKENADDENEDDNDDEDDEEKPSYDDDDDDYTEAEKFDINIEKELSGGKIILNKEEASRHSKVTFEVSAEDGFSVDEVKVYDEKGNKLEVKDNGDGTYSFTMPKGNVYIDAVFEDNDGKEECIILQINNVVAEVFGNKVVNDVAPVIRNDRTMLPVRLVAENLGAVVKWDDETDKVIIIKDDAAIEIFINSAVAFVGGQPVDLDSPAFIENSRTYLPVRFVAEALGAEVKWIEDEQKIVIIPQN